MENYRINIFNEMLPKTNATTSQTIMQVTVFSRLNTISVTNFLSNKNITFQDKAKCMENARICF